MNAKDFYLARELRGRIQEELFNHPLYVSGYYKKLCIILNPEDRLRLQAICSDRLEGRHMTFDENFQEYLYGVIIKISRYLQEGQFQIYELPDKDDWFKREVSLISIKHKEVCEGCGAPITKQVCEYCGRKHW